MRTDDKSTKLNIAIKGTEITAQLDDGVIEHLPTPEIMQQLAQVIFSKVVDDTVRMAANDELFIEKDGSIAIGLDTLHDHTMYQLDEKDSILLNMFQQRPEVDKAELVKGTLFLRFKPGHIPEESMDDTTQNPTTES